MGDRLMNPSLLTDRSSECETIFLSGTLSLNVDAIAEFLVLNRA